jgi:valyl-tRNA synthetase
MPGLDPTVGKEAPILFLVLSFFIVFGYLAVRLAGKAVDFIKARDAAFLGALEKLSTDLQNEQERRSVADRLSAEKRDEMWRSFVKDQWMMMSKSLDAVADQIVSLGAKVDQHDRRTTAQHEIKPRGQRD